jgi:hypothetical protein
LRAIQAQLSFGTRRNSRRVQHRLLMLAVTGVCLVLLALLSVAQVAHLHSDGADADHCPLCIIMHTAAPAVVAAVAIVMVRMGAFTPSAEPALVFHQRQSSLFIRPPPAGC